MRSTTSRPSTCRTSITSEVLVCGGDADARATVISLVDAIAGLRGLDAGTMDSAGAIEALTAVLVQVNVRYRTHSMLRLVGNFDG